MKAIRRRRAYAICAALVAVLPACSARSAPKLVFQLQDRPTQSAEITFSSRVAHFSLELDSFLCSTRSVDITSLQLYQPSPGMRLVRWGLANEPFDQVPTPHDGALSSIGPYTSHVLTARCHRTRWYARVGLELLRTRPGVQSFCGVQVTYDSAGSKQIGYIGEGFRIRDPAR